MVQRKRVLLFYRGHQKPFDDKMRFLLCIIIWLLWYLGVGGLETVIYLSPEISNEGSTRCSSPTRETLGIFGTRIQMITRNENLPEQP